MEFTYDPQKSASNKAKHGIDFHDAKALWRGKVIEIDAEFRTGEKRYTNIGKIGDDFIRRRSSLIVMELAGSFRYIPQTFVR